MAVGIVSHMGRPKKPEKTEPLRVPESFAQKVRFLALHHKKDPGDYLKDQFGAELDRLHAQMLAEKMREPGGPVAATGDLGAEAVRVRGRKKGR